MPRIIGVAAREGQSERAFESALREALQPDLLKACHTFYSRAISKKMDIDLIENHDLNAQVFPRRWAEMVGIDHLKNAAPALASMTFTSLHLLSGDTRHAVRIELNDMVQMTSAVPFDEAVVNPGRGETKSITASDVLKEASPEERTIFLNHEHADRDRRARHALGSLLSQHIFHLHLTGYAPDAMSLMRQSDEILSEHLDGDLIRQFKSRLPTHIHWGEDVVTRDVSELEFSFDERHAIVCEVESAALSLVERLAA